MRCAVVVDRASAEMKLFLRLARSASTYSVRTSVLTDGFRRSTNVKVTVQCTFYMPVLQAGWYHWTDVAERLAALVEGFDAKTTTSACHTHHWKFP
jgi:capsule polysaccharide export protein KpsC/LpsZ